MQYGHFDNEKREYVIDRVDLPVSWTNYIGTGDMYGVFNHTAGGYLIYKSSEYHRITRFRPNGVPMDFPGHYVYLRDDETGKYWSISWQPTGIPLRREAVGARSERPQAIGNRPCEVRSQYEFISLKTVPRACG